MVRSATPVLHFHFQIFLVTFWTRTTHMFAVFVVRRVPEYVLTCTNEVLRTIDDVKSAL